MLENSAKIHLTVDPKDLTCPICFLSFGLEENLPVSVNCGHTFCSVCIKKINKCAICQMLFYQRQTFNKSILISSFLKSTSQGPSPVSSQGKKCPVHQKFLEGFCLEMKRWVCFDCLAAKQAILTVKDIEEKANRLSKLTKEAEGYYKAQVEKYLQAEQDNFKRHIDKIFNGDICYIPVLRERLYKEIQGSMKFGGNYNENRLQEKLKSIEATLEKWRRSDQQGNDLAVEILEIKLDEEIVMGYVQTAVAQFKNESNLKQIKLLAEINNNRMLIKCLNTKFKKVFEKPPYMILDFVNVDLELEYLVEIFKEFNLLAKQNNHRELLVLKDLPPTNFKFKFNPMLFDCRIKVLNIGCLYSVNVLELLPILAQILENVANLQYFNLTLYKISEFGLGVLPNLLQKLKNVKEFSIRINSINEAKPLVAKLANHFRSRQWFSRFEIRLESGFFYEALRAKLI